MLLRWILVLLLLPAVMVLTGSSASPLNLQNGLAHNRTSRGQDCYEDEYEHKGICCKNCPAGTYVSIHCTLTHHRGACEPCDSGESFTAYPNGMESCLPCLTCTADKVLVKECTPTSNAECECKPGYYCTPDEPCEICARCSRCGEGQRMKKNCTSSSNTVCEDVSPPKPTSTKADVKDRQTVPAVTKSFENKTRMKAGTAVTNFFENVTGIQAAPTEPPDESAKSKTVTTIISIVGVFLIIVILIIAGIYLWKRYHTDNNKNSLIDTTQNTSVNTSLDSVMTEGNDPKGEERCPERQRLMTPESVKVEHEVNRTAVPYERVAQSEPMENNTPEPLGGDEENEEIPQLGTPCGECGNPQPCERQWVEFFYLVIENACVDRRVEHARKLHLRKATIAQTLNDNANSCKEQYYQLLEQWRYQKGTQASMKDVLRVLEDMDLGGCCENITNSLRAKKIPMN